MPEPEPEPDLKDTPSIHVGLDINPIVRGVGLMIPIGVDPATITPPEATPIGSTPADEPRRGPGLAS